MTTENGRGRVVVAEQVVSKIAAQAAAEADARGTGRRFGFGERRVRPEVSVRLDGGSATITVETALPFPASVRAAAGEISRQVAGQVQRLSGVPVRRVDVTVRRLDPAELQPNGSGPQPAAARHASRPADRTRSTSRARRLA